MDSTHLTCSRRNLFVGGALVALAGAALGATGCSSDANSSSGATSVKTGVKAEGAYQLDKTYPVKPGSDNFDDSLVTNVLDTFTSFEGQGKLLVHASNPEDFKVFVNGSTISLDGVPADEWAEIDISSLTVNGANKLQVCCTNYDSDATCDVAIPYPELIDATKDNEDNDAFKLIDEIIQAEIDNGFTSAELCITHNGKIVKESAYGLCNSYDQSGKRLTDGAKVTTDTLYDIASNTKMFATNYAIQKLVSDGKLDITKRVQDYIPEFRDSAGDAIKGKDALTVQEILQHQAGFPADPQYHNIDYDPTYEDPETGVKGKVIEGSNANKALYTQNRDEALSKIIATPLDYEPGTNTVYSDVDYMLLGFIVERISGKRLDEYVRESYYEPLGLKHVTFNPLDNGFTKDDCAATELNGNTRDGVISFSNVRTDTIQGEVHDEKAYYTMGGVSGHAGLFSNAHDLAVLTQIIINKGGYGDHKFFDANTLDQFIKPKDTNPTYGLGWRREADKGYYFYFSPLSSSATVGHTGWTGTLTVVDPVNNVSVVLLTNTKNSPVIDNQVDPNDFVGNHYLTGNYGMGSTLAYDGIDGTSAEMNAAKLADMAQCKYQLIETTEFYQTEPDRSALKALTQVIEKRKGDATLKSFMETDIWDEITSSVA